MMSLNKIDQVKEVADLVEVVSDFVVLKKRGSSYFGLSPFNNEKTPSFVISPAKSIFKDFSSGKGGDVISFLMQANSWTFMQAIKYLAKKYNIELDNNDFVFIPTIRQHEPPKPPDLIHPDELLPTIENVKDNNLFIFMANRFGEQITLEVFKQYYIGIDHTNDYTKHFVIFWQVDKNYMIRSAKYIKYLPDGHRDKSQNPSWFHKRMENGIPVYINFNLVQCFFGEHLINTDRRKPIAIVESEKTAVIASLLMDRYIWMACGSKNGLTNLKCEVLQNRSVTLFPDLGAYSEWSDIAKKHSYSINGSLEKIANDHDREKGLDIADFLLR